MDQTTVTEIVRASRLFDEAWYRRAYPDVAMLDLDPALHYVRYGAGLGRDPGPGFNTRFYLANHPDALGRGANALLHFLAGGPDRAAEHPPGDAERLLSGRAADGESVLRTGTRPASSADLVRPHFDAGFYREQGADIPAGMDPMEHFLAIGWRLGLAPNRWFDPLGYTVLHKHLLPSGLNPYLHFLRQGHAKGAAPNPYFRDQYFRHPDLERLGPVEYGPVSHILKYCEAGPREQWDLGRICIHVHAFHPHMLGDVRIALARIPAPFTLLVSVPEESAIEEVQAFLASGLDLATRIVVRAVPNRGRDVAPWIIHFQDEVANSDIFCHFHTKQSTHATEHQYWFRFLCHSILGSQEIVSQIFDMFMTDDALGLISPAYWPTLRRQPDFRKTKPAFGNLLARLGIDGYLDLCPDYPAGSFFWCRTRILAPLFKADLALTDFSEEQGQVTNTLAHAIERVIGVLSIEAGLKTAFVASDWSHELAAQRPVDIEFAPDELVTDPRLTVSVVIPTWNRGQSLIRALDSVFAQTLVPKDVIVIDDGSEDGTVGLVERTFADRIERGQLKLIAAEHQGVAAARNAGLEAATGDVITYLDSDNTWRPQYVAHVITAFTRFPNALSTFTDWFVHDTDENRVGRSSDLFRPMYDRAALVQQNFIDLNVFAHRRTIIEFGHRFDVDLKRVVDWDFIISVTFHRAPVHVRYVGADYYLDKKALGNITRTVPLPENKKRVMTKHRRERVFYQQEPLSFAIKCPAPIRDAARAWGDLYFAMSLCSALERLGCQTRIDMRETWGKEKDEQDDVVIVLKGLGRYKPNPKHINLMWHISHPDKVGLAEMREFDHVFVASYRETLALIPHLGTKVSVLLQCSDPDLFYSGPVQPNVPKHDLLFVGNSRGVERWMPKTCVDRGLPVSVYGRDWKGRLPEPVVVGNQVRNQQLSSYYRSAKIVLNDHWPDMARRGFISNRIFDAGLSGALVISDRFEGAEIFFGSVVTCANGADLEENARFFLANDEIRHAFGNRLRQIVALSHTFDHRAREIVRVAQRIAAFRLGLPAGIASSSLDVSTEHFPISRSSTPALSGSGSVLMPDYELTESE